MKKIFKKLIVGLSLVMICCCVMGMSAYAIPTVAYAAETPLTVDDYTDADNLIKANGDASDKTIHIFAKEVKNAIEYTSFPELTEVIPVEYLESTKYSDTFYYNGKEYGFFVVKEGDYFDVLLIDFKFEFDNMQSSDIEYKIRIEPILQQSFYRSQTLSGEYEWRKYIGSGERYAYYVANPRFLTFVQNENALNYGDNGYSKYNDEGVIILQSRADYGKVSYKTETDLLGEVAKFAGEQILDAALEVADVYTYGVASKIADVIEFGANLYKESKEVTVETNSAMKIYSRQSKTAQRDNDLIDGYSRVAGFRPIEEIVLSADVNSYAEFITVLSDANYRARLSEFCDFDIVRRIPNSFTSMQYVTGAEEDRAFSFDKINVLYDDKTITGLDSAAITQESFAYFLENGDHKFKLNCQDSTTYQIHSNNPLSKIDVYNNGQPITTQVIDENTVEVFLERGNEYEFVFSQEQAGYYNFTFNKKVEEITNLGDSEIRAITQGESLWYKYVSPSNQYLSLGVNEGLYDLSVYKSNLLESVPIQGGQVVRQIYVEKGETYYIQIKNKTDFQLPATVFNINGVDEILIGSESETFAVSGVRRFAIDVPIEGRYCIAQLSEGLTATINAEYENGAYRLDTENNYYVTVSGQSVNATCTLEYAVEEIFISGGTPSYVEGVGKTCLLSLFLYNL